MPFYTSLEALGPVAGYLAYKYFHIDDIALRCSSYSTHLRVGPIRHPLHLVLISRWFSFPVGRRQWLETAEPRLVGLTSALADNPLLLHDLPPSPLALLTDRAPFPIGLHGRLPGGTLRSEREQLPVGLLLRCRGFAGTEAKAQNAPAELPKDMAPTAADPASTLLATTEAMAGCEAHPKDPGCETHLWQRAALGGIRGGGDKSERRKAAWRRGRGTQGGRRSMRGRRRACRRGHGRGAPPAAPQAPGDDRREGEPPLRRT